jgi:hypothetical protein
VQSLLLTIGVLAGAVLFILALTPVVDAHRRLALRRALPEVCRIFEAAGVDYWCDFGTLLGYYREGDIIRGDKDVDLSALATEKPKIMALAEVFRTRGYHLTDRGGGSRKLLRIYDARTRYYVDVYPYLAEGDLLRSVLTHTEDVPARLVQPRAGVPFLGATLRVPEDVPALLVHRYGPDFMRPRRGDKGTARPYTLVRSVLEDLQDNCLGVRSLVRDGYFRLRYRRKPSQSQPAPRAMSPEP